jgi:hypothetical protein
MAESLRRITQLLSRNCDLFGEDVQVVPKAEHVLEYADCLAEVLFFVCASLEYVHQCLFELLQASQWPYSREGFYQPECAHAKRLEEVTRDQYSVICN